IQMLPPRTGQNNVDSLIINKKQANWIKSKIVESKTRQLQENQGTSINQDDVDAFYKLTLLYRRSRDGDTATKFRELCNDKGTTVVVGKVLDTEEILGGYNPFSWISGGEQDSKESFIFALDGNMHNNIVSFVGDDSSHAIADYA